jgi:ADP-dependent NAD(P)H-hydrate dehydratase / NAD(P)H-hydrate epimerase
MRALTAQQMREADGVAIARAGEVALMRRAGEAIAEALRATAREARRIVAFAGPGNNGGDAFAALADVGGAGERVVYAAASPRRSDARADAERRAEEAGVAVRALPTDEAGARAALDGADIALDALLGTGARPQGDTFAPAIRALNASSAAVVAVDIPTGVDATTGAVPGEAVWADLTVTLGALKVGLLLSPAKERCGALWLADIGIEAAEIDAAPGDRFAALDDREFLALLPKRDPEADKRSAGAPLIVAGSAQFPGAAVLAALGAARAGAGYVTVCAPADAAAAVRGHLVEQVVTTYDPADPERAVEGLLDLTGYASAAGIGPGLGLEDAIGRIVRGFMQGLALPFVVDASGLFHLAKHLDVLAGKRCVVTPHEGEFARLSGEGTVAAGTRVRRLRSFVARTGITTLLKGNATLIDDGTTMHVNITGTPALATAGSGDVLTGITATLLAQGLAPVDAARVGAYWHGLAGRHAANERIVGVVAGDIVDALGPAYAGALARVASQTRSLITRIC